MGCFFMPGIYLPLNVFFKLIAMKYFNSKKSSRRNPLGFLLVSAVCLILGGCASVETVSESPLRVGYGFRVTPGMQIKNGNSSAHLVAGYSRIAFQGGGGRNDIFLGGLQFRHALTAKSPEGFWIGAEASYLYFNNKFDNSSTKQSASGFSIGPMAGYRFLAGKLPLSAYLAPGYLRRGKFKTNGTTGGVAGNGFFGRVGIDIHLMSLLTKKGR